MDPSPNDRVPCNGPCRKLFRPADVNMDQATVDFLLSPGRTPGLQWHCPDCQYRSFNKQQITKRNRFYLPPELWIMIFRYLDYNSMLCVRKTCRRWKKIVDQNRSLQRKFHVIIENKVTVDGQYKPEYLFPASQASFLYNKIISVNCWWASVGIGLAELLLLSCEIALPVLLGMLKETPNLTRLTLHRTDFTATEEVDVDFRLEKLEYLYCSRVLYVFRKIFPRLKKLKLSPGLEEDETEKCRLLETVQGTLQELDCQLTPFMLEQMANMHRLQLKSFKVLYTEGQFVVQLSRIQNTIEELTIHACNEDLCQIGRNLTQLKKVNVTIADEGTAVPLFLTEMPQLTSLDLHGVAYEFDDLNFKRLKSANLNHLILRYNIIGAKLQRFLTNCPNLEVLEIRYSKLDSWSNVFAARLRSLRSLTLLGNTWKENTMILWRSLPNLKELEISEASNITTEMLLELLRRCPRLEKLKLCLMDEINDTFVSSLGEFPQLKELHMKDCPLTDQSVRWIVDARSHLKVELKCNQITVMAMSLLSYAMQTQ